MQILKDTNFIMKSPTHSWEIAKKVGVLNQAMSKNLINLVAMDTRFLTEVVMPEFKEEAHKALLWKAYPDAIIRKSVYDGPPPFPKQRITKVVWPIADGYMPSVIDK